MNLRTALVAILGLAVPSLALAQKGKPLAPDGVPDKPDEESADPDEGGEAAGEGGADVELEDDPPPEDMEGTAENPDAPRLEEGKSRVKVPVVKRAGYPQEEVLRPLTLPAVTSEVGLNAGFIVDNGASTDLELGLRARYGINRQWQLGLTYLIGGIYEDQEAEATKFNTGKAFGLDVSYLAKDFVAGHLTVPVYVDPVAVGLTLGAPMKFRFAKDWLAIIALDDVLDIRIYEFIPSLTNEAANEVVANDVNENTNTVKTKALVHLRAGIEFQLQPKLMVGGQFIQTIPVGADSGTFAGTNVITKPRTTLEGFGQLSPSPKFDVFGRIGWQALDDLGGSFGLTVGAQFRI